MTDDLTGGADVAAAYAALVEASPADLLTPLVDASGGRLLEVAREDVVYRPGRDAVLRFAATVERGGRSAREGWVVAAGRAAEDAPLGLDGPVGRVGAWRVRDDPGLPSLRSALDVPTVAGMLTALGLPAEGLVLELVAVRPRRRAVVLARTPTRELYLKCVPPDKAAALHRRHVACREAGLPVPAAVGVDPGLGLLVLTPVRGDGLRPGLMAEGAVLPPPAEVVSLASSFGLVSVDEPARDPLRQARGHAALLRTVVPEQAGRVDELLGRVRAVADDGLRRGVHGDFYDGQVLVRDGQVTGVVDVDGVGLGHPADDAGNLLAHLLLLRTLVPAGAGVHGWLPPLAAELRAVHDTVQLGRRTAAVLLGLATWPHSRQSEGWQAQTSAILDLAEQALDGRF